MESYGEIFLYINHNMVNCHLCIIVHVRVCVFSHIQVHIVGVGCGGWGLVVRIDNVHKSLSFFMTVEYNIYILEL